MSLAISTFNRESCLPSRWFSADLLVSRMESEERETLANEVKEMSGRGEFSEGKSKGNCALLSRKTHPPSAVEELWRVKAPGACPSLGLSWG